MSQALKISPARRKDPPLCVDLDHTLLKIDSMVELLFQYLKKRPLQAPKLVFKLFKGIAYLKEELATNVNVDVSKLPMNEEVVSYLRQEQSKGRKIILVTGAHISVAKAVANHLRIFSEVHATRDNHNLVGRNKAKFLVEKFGEKKYDYMGDSRADLVVWESANNAIFVGGKRRVLRKAERFGNVTKIIPRRAVNPIIIAKSLRCHQWLKNILVLLPIFFAHRLSEMQLLLQGFIGFFAFCFAASSIYIINDIMDINDDRMHPDKRKRPFASGDLSLLWAFVLTPVMLGSAVLCASFLSPSFQLILAGYLLLTSLYNFWLKQIAIADILVLACLFCGRLFAGGAASEINLSPWLIAFTGFFFLSLALVKRCSELVMLQGLNESHSRGRGYQVQDVRLLISLGVSSGYLSILVLALYLSSENARILYERKDFLWATCPIALYWLSRVWLLTNRGEMHSDPISFALKDKLSWIMLGMVFVVWCAANGFQL